MSMSSAQVQSMVNRIDTAKNFLQCAAFALSEDTIESTVQCGIGAVVDHALVSLTEIIEEMAKFTSKVPS